MDNITTIIFDVGNTLRIVVKDPAFAADAERELMELVGTTEAHDAFFEKLEANYKKYRKYAKTGLLDASETELWTQWMLPDYDVNRVAKHSARLTRLWRNHDGRRVARADCRSTIEELYKRGYTLGIIANTITESEIPDWMVEDEVVGYFKTVVLSSKVRIRKPDPEIYLLTARVLGVRPEECAYVGDNPVRDVEGAHAANYGAMILLHEQATVDREPPKDGIEAPDAVIYSLSDLLGLFPGIQ